MTFWVFLVLSPVWFVLFIETLTPWSLIAGITWLVVGYVGVKCSK